MRVAIASRIFEPEPSAASFRLNALATALSDAGHAVEVLTVKPPKKLRIEARDDHRTYVVRRARVIRDGSGYVRGYIPYMSFDIPLFFRLLFSRRFDLLIAEPPPTTGFFVRIASKLRRVPYVYYAPDIWSDASAQTGAPGIVVRLVRAMELFAIRGAKIVLSVSPGVTQRLTELGMSSRVATIGNGVDVDAFDPVAASQTVLNPSRDFVYAGTASEWHGAGVFLEALPQVLSVHPDISLVYIGGGSQRKELERRSRELGVDAAVRFEDVMSPASLGPELRNCCAAIASVLPGAGYDFAFPTKLYSAAVCGAPTIYSGVGPGSNFVNSKVHGLPIGKAVDHDVNEVAAAMIEAATEPFDIARRHAVAAWASREVSLTGVAYRAVENITAALIETETRSGRPGAK